MDDTKTINLKGLSLKELEALKGRVEKAIAKANAAQKKTALAAVKAVLAKRGFTLADIQTNTPTPRRGRRAGPKPKAKRPSPPKYCNPKDQTKTWTGKGRQPDWFKEAMNSGKTPEQMEITAKVGT